MTKLNQRVADIQWSKVRWNGLLVSLGLMFISIVLISTKGFTLGLEFTGGISHVVNADVSVSLEAMQSALNTVFDELPNLVPDVTYQTWQLQFPIGGTGELELLQWLRAVELS